MFEQETVRGLAGPTDGAGERSFCGLHPHYITGVNPIDAALAYADMGLVVLPLLPKSKEPATRNGFKDATTDAKQIAAWRADANIGAVPGSAGLLVLDFDTYKPSFGPDAQALLDRLQAEYPTLTDISGGGSPRLWYRLADGEVYGNATGALPKGVDVRSSGGYVAVAPSIHPNGNAYRWADGPSEPAPLPDIVRALLTAPKAKRTGPTEAPQATRPAITVDDAALVEKMLQNPDTAALWRGDLAAYGGDHSAADMALCNKLAWWSNRNPDQMDRLFRQSGLYRRKWERQGYRERTIAAALATCIGGYDPDHHTPTPEQTESLTAILRAELARTTTAAGLIEDATETTRKVWAAVLKLALQTGKPSVMGYRRIALEAGIGTMSVRPHLDKLAAAGRIALVEPAKKGQATIVKVIVSELYTSYPSDPCEKQLYSLDTITGFYADHLSDDAFTRPHWTHTQRRVDAGLNVEDAFGVAGGLVIEHLAAGATSRQGLATLTGLGLQTVGRITRKLEDAGLVVVAGLTGKTGRTKVYALAGDLAQTEAALDDLRPDLKTAGMAQVRLYRSEAQRAAWLDREMRVTTAAGTPERAAMQERRDAADAKAMAALDGLEAIGIDPRKPVKRDAAPKAKLLRLDPASEWERHWQPIWVRWCELGDLPRHERLYILEADGYSQEDVTKTLTYWVPKMVKAQVDYYGMAAD